MKGVVETHKNLDVWARAMDATEAIYRLSAQIRADERFGLVAQMRRAAVSIPSNIAEGAARGTSADFVRFLHIARGSLAELETQLMLVDRLQLARVNIEIYDDLRIIRQMLIALARSLNRRKL